MLKARLHQSGPSRRHGWIPRVRVIPGNGLDSLGDLLGTRFRPQKRRRSAEAASSGEVRGAVGPFAGLQSKWKVVRRVM